MATQVIDLCQQGLCMADAEVSVKVSSGSRSVTLQLCGTHLTELQDKAITANNEGDPIDLVVTPIRRGS